jgi:tetratricopeptide (TPR) repeat protein
VLSACALAAGGGVAVAAPPPATTTPAPVTTAPAPVAVPAPTLASLRLPTRVTAQQGHARLLVGVRLSAPAKLTIQVTQVKGGKVVQTLTDAAARPAGRAYVRIEGVDSAGYQLLAGAYRVSITAADDQGRVSAPLTGRFTLKLTTARGLLDVYTIPLYRGFMAQARTQAPGQLVAAVAPKGAAARAGIKVGDVITSLNGASVARPGAFSAALRALPAGKPVTVVLTRRGVSRSATMTPDPDWTPAAKYAASLTVIARRNPTVAAYGIARAQQLVDAGETAAAKKVIAGWPAAWRRSAPGQLVQGALMARQKRNLQALGAYNRAHKRDRTIGAAEVGRGLALSALGRTAQSASAFTLAAKLDPTDPVAAGLRSYALLKLDRPAAAVAAGRTAVGLDPRYADAFLPLGIALLAEGQKATGVKMLRRGLILLDDPARAERVIARRLDPTDP